MGALNVLFKGHFTPNPGMLTELLTDALYKSELESRVDDAVAKAKAIAPHASGDYAAGIRGEIIEGPDGNIGRINADDFKSHWVEWGTARQSPRAPLRKAAVAADLTLKETSR